MNSNSKSHMTHILFHAVKERHRLADDMLPVHVVLLLQERPQRTCFLTSHSPSFFLAVLSILRHEYFNYHHLQCSTHATQVGPGGYILYLILCDLDHARCSWAGVLLVQSTSPHPESSRITTSLWSGHILAFVLDHGTDHVPDWGNDANCHRLRCSILCYGHLVPPWNSVVSCIQFTVPPGC